MCDSTCKHHKCAQGLVYNRITIRQTLNKKNKKESKKNKYENGNSKLNKQNRFFVFTSFCHQVTAIDYVPQLYRFPLSPFPELTYFSLNVKT